MNALDDDDNEQPEPEESNDGSENLTIILDIRLIFNF